MPAVVDSNILYGWRNANDEHHDVGEGIVDASKQAQFPTLHIPRVFYLETIKHVHNELGYSATLETIEMIRDAPQLSVIGLREQDYNLGAALFSTDDDFDRFDDLTRLNTAVPP